MATGVNASFSHLSLPLSPQVLLPLMYGKDDGTVVVRESLM
jgi:hypothetical protein